MWTDFRRIRMKIRELQRRQWAAISRFAYTCTVSIRLEQVKHNFSPAACSSPQSGRHQPLHQIQTSSRTATRAPDQHTARANPAPCPIATIEGQSQKENKMAIWHHRIIAVSTSTHPRCVASQAPTNRFPRCATGVSHRARSFLFPYTRPKLGRLPRERLR